MSTIPRMKLRTLPEHDTATPPTDTPTPIELATLAATIGRTDHAGVEEALRLYQHAVAVAGAAQRAAKWTALNSESFTCHEIMGAADIMDVRTLQGLVTWGCTRDGYPPEWTERFVAEYFTPGNRKPGQELPRLGECWLEQVRTWQHERKSENGKAGGRPRKSEDGKKDRPRKSKATGSKTVK